MLERTTHAAQPQNDTSQPSPSKASPDASSHPQQGSDDVSTSGQPMQSAHSSASSDRTASAGPLFEAPNPFKLRPRPVQEATSSYSALPESSAGASPSQGTGQVTEPAHPLLHGCPQHNPMAAVQDPLMLLAAAVIQAGPLGKSDQATASPPSSQKKKKDKDKDKEGEVAAGRISKNRSSRFKGVTKHRRSGRWEAHIWVKEMGRQVYLGGYAHEEHAAEAYDVAAIKCKGSRVKTNFDPNGYNDLAELMDSISLEELIMAVRRQSQGFSRGTSTYKGVTHHPSGRWEARIGIPGSKHIYLGLFNEEKEAAQSYDRALVRLRGTSAATNFALSDYHPDLADYHKMQQTVLQSGKHMVLCLGGATEFEKWIKYGSSPDEFELGNETAQSASAQKPSQGGTAERNNRISEARAAAYDRAALKSKNAMQAAADAIAAVDQPVDDEQISDTDTDDEMQGVSPKWELLQSIRKGTAASQKSNAG